MALTAIAPPDLLKDLKQSLRLKSDCKILFVPQQSPWGRNLRPYPSTHCKRTSSTKRKLPSYKLSSLS